MTQKELIKESLEVLKGWVEPCCGSALGKCVEGNCDSKILVKKLDKMVKGKKW